VGAGLYEGVNPAQWIDFWYDATQRPSQIRLLSGNTVLGYDSENLPNSITFPSGLTESSYYTSSHMLSQRLYNVQAVKDSFDRSYRTDSLARLVERSIGTVGKFQDFTYDLKGRLWTWGKLHQTGGPTCQNLGGYGYDCSSANAIRDSINGTTFDAVDNNTDLGATFDPGNRLRTYNSVSLLYDADGNLVRRVSATTDSLLWDDFGQLREVRQNGTTVATYTYDGFGRRIKKVAGATTVHYIWDGDQVAAEADGTGAVTQMYSYYPGIDRLHSVTTASNGQTYYASIEPATGDVNGLVNGSTNAVVASYAYTPWGEIETSSQQVAGLNSLRWKGLIWDAEAKLYYMRGRYYDPKIRRFISEDPIGLSGGINQYAFANGDPINGTDPFGLDARKCEKAEQTSIPDLGYVGDPVWRDGTCTGGGGGAPLPSVPIPNGQDFPEPPTPTPGPPTRPGGPGGPGDSAAPRCRVGSTPSTRAGQEALEFYQAVWASEQSSGLEKTGAAVGGFFAALWTPETASKTLETLLIGYSAEAYRPTFNKGLPRSVLRSRQTFRVDRPHHGKGWEIDGTITGRGPRGTRTFVDGLGTRCP
jgi:RHS repeat-associated protein